MDWVSVLFKKPASSRYRLDASVVLRLLVVTTSILCERLRLVHDLHAVIQVALNVQNLALWDELSWSLFGVFCASFMRCI